MNFLTPPLTPPLQVLDNQHTVTKGGDMGVESAYYKYFEEEEEIYRGSCRTPRVARLRRSPRGVL